MVLDPHFHEDETHLQMPRVIRVRNLTDLLTYCRVVGKAETIQSGKGLFGN
jgi:hypothetical protein